MREGLCKTIMIFGDDFADNPCTFRCMLPDNHEGRHREWGNLHGKYPYTLEWDGDMTEEEPSDQEA